MGLSIDFTAKGKSHLKEDLTGRRFGKLIVIGREPNIVSKGGIPQTAWKCRCDCGRESVVRGVALVTNSVTSCGKCGGIVHAGMKFGSLTVLREAEHARTRSGISKKRWVCKCDCGNEIVVAQSRLLSSSAMKTCGCQSNRHGMSNTEFYNKWRGMKYWCKKLERERGISAETSLCREWFDFKAFRRDMESTFSKGTFIRRYDENKPYSKENCYWETVCCKNKPLGLEESVTLKSDEEKVKARKLRQTWLGLVYRHPDEMCARWAEFRGFWEDMAEGYRFGLSIHRISRSEIYSKENCEWVEQ